MRIDEELLLGGIEKAEVLEVLRPLIFFDDQLKNLERAQVAIPAAHVPFEGPQVAMFQDAALAAPVHIGSLYETLVEPASPTMPTARDKIVAAMTKEQSDESATAEQPNRPPNAVKAR